MRVEGREGINGQPYQRGRQGGDSASDDIPIGIQHRFATLSARPKPDAASLALTGEIRRFTLHDQQVGQSRGMSDILRSHRGECLHVAPAGWLEAEIAAHRKLRHVANRPVQEPGIPIHGSMR